MIYDVHSAHPIPERNPLSSEHGDQNNPLDVFRTDPVVAGLVLVVDPVELLVGAVLDAVLGDPLVGVTAALGQQARHHQHLPQVHLQPLAVVLELGEPRTPAGGQTGLGGEEEEKNGQ